MSRLSCGELSYVIVGRHRRQTCCLSERESNRRVYKQRVSSSESKLLDKNSRKRRVDISAETVSDITLLLKNLIQ